MIERILELFVIRVNSLAKRTQSYAERTQYRAEMRSNRLLAKQLAGADGFSYTQDYISDYISLWEEHLAPFKGKTGVAALEVGSYEGRSAVWLLENILTAPDALITCVDPLWGAGDEPRFRHNIRVSGREAKMRSIQKRSVVALQELAGERFDFIYIDGDHSAAPVLMDAHLAWQLLKPQGVIIFDDYEWDLAETPEDRPKMAIDLFMDACSGQFDLLHHGWQVLLKKK